MNPEERARKWTQDIPELSGLTLQQRITICNQVSKRIVFLAVLWLTLFFAIVFVILSIRFSMVVQVSGTW